MFLTNFRAPNTFSSHVIPVKETERCAHVDGPYATASVPALMPISSARPHQLIEMEDLFVAQPNH